MLHVYFMYPGGEFYRITVKILCEKSFIGKICMVFYQPTEYSGFWSILVSGFQIKDIQSVIVYF